MVRIDTKRGREGLTPRREPYWYKLSRDRHLGLRRLTQQSTGAWIARFRAEDGQRAYKALGECCETFDFDSAKAAAEGWFRDRERGVHDRDDEGGPATVATACRSYVQALRAEGRTATAQDAHMRFRRTVYGDTYDSEFGPRGASNDVGVNRDQSASISKAEARRIKRRKAKPVAQPIADVPLSKVRAPRLRSWHLDLFTAGLSKAAANRTLTALKAPLNFAVKSRTVSPVAAQEWREVVPFKGASRRRELFLDVTQRRALLENAQGAVAHLLQAVMFTGCRAGELVAARRSAFDSRTKTLSVTGKTGTRTFPLTHGGRILRSIDKE